MEAELEAETALTVCCLAVTRAIERFDEERSLSTLDILLFHSNHLYRCLLVYAEDDGSDRIKQSWLTHPMSSENGHTPLQMWTRGLLELGNC